MGVWVVKLLAQGLLVGEGWSWDLNSVCLIPKSIVDGFNFQGGLSPFVLTQSHGEETAV